LVRKKVTFPSPRLQGVVLREVERTLCWASGRGCWSCSQESYFFADDMCTKKILKKNANTLVSSEKSFGIPVVCENGGVDMNPIITAHQEIVIENSVRYIELLKSEATKILDEYWETWKARNQLISQTTYANGGKFMPGRFAPVFKKVGSSQKLTIVWKDFSPRFKNKIEHHGVVVKPKLGGYSVSCFKNALDWELEMILETENKIKPIRELLAEYHQRKLADIKRLEKLKRLI
ncbi:TPA: conjugative transfer protein MobI(A/C), partial [Klebsiella pneumoniae]